MMTMTMTGKRKSDSYYGRLAATIVRRAGGVVSWDEYDKLMWPVLYYPPLVWLDGWGEPGIHKRNCDKRCAFVACRDGLLEPDDEAQTYTITDRGREADEVVNHDPLAVFLSKGEDR